jgi:hypothetical protein
MGERAPGLDRTTAKILESFAGANQGPQSLSITHWWGRDVEEYTNALLHPDRVTYQLRHTKFELAAACTLIATQR